MKRLISTFIISIVAIFTVSSCDLFEPIPISCEARLTCSYAGMLEDLQTDPVYFEFDNNYINDNDIIYIFEEILSSSKIKPNFIDAWLDINIYNLDDQFLRTESYYFWWDDIEGAYLFEEEEEE